MLIHLDGSEDYKEEGLDISNEIVPSRKITKIDKKLSASNNISKIEKRRL